MAWGSPAMSSSDVRELMFGARRFGELRQGLPGISANVLTQRLEGLEAAGILVRRQLPSPANAQVYELTPWGYEADVLLQVIGRWAARSPAHDPSLPRRVAASFVPHHARSGAREGRPHHDGPRAERRAIHGEGRARGDHPRARNARGADATLSGAPPALAALVYGGRSMAEADVRVLGSRTAARVFCGLFTLAAKA